MDRLIEFATNHPLLVAGFAAVLLLLIWTELKRRIGGIKELTLKDKKLLVVCKNGVTAVSAASSLQKMGAQDVAVLKGGMSAWRSDQFPVTTKK